MSDLLARLIEVGTPAALVAEVARELARAEVAQEAISQRREKDRNRQAEKRARDNVTSRDIADITPDPSLSLPPNENNSNPPTHTHPDNITRAREADPFPRPEWADQQVWKDWMEVRRAKKARNTPTAYAGFLASIEREATDEWPPGRLLAHAVTESWKSIHRPKDFRNDYPARREPPRRDEIQNPYARAVAARQAARSGDEWGQPGGWSECG